MEKMWTSSSLLLLLLLIYLSMPVEHLAEVAVPAVFVFGDSTADVGTNNYLTSLAKADKPFNGIDYPNSIPTGRFSNGFNGIDQIVRLMEYKRSPPPFFALLNRSSSFQRNILQGANFASGGSGLLDKTGQVRFGNFSRGANPTICDSPRQHHKITRSCQGYNTGLLSQSLFLISTGSNDLFESYFNSSFPSLIKNDFFTTLLRSTYVDHLKNLYHLGARKFGIIGVPPIGCCPYPRTLNATGGCIDELNKLARTLHTRIEDLLQKLSSELKEMRYSLGNTYEMTMILIEDPYAFKFKDVQSACCGEGRLNGSLPCSPTANLCSNRHEFLFWDWFHPTEAAAELAALTLYGGAQRFVTPINFSQLVKVDP